MDGQPDACQFAGSHRPNPGDAFQEPRPGPFKFRKTAMAHIERASFRSDRNGSVASAAFKAACQLAALCPIVKHITYKVVPPKL